MGCSDNKTSAPITQESFASATEIAARLGKGINVGNALDAPAEGDWGVTLQADYFAWIADSGFQTVRIPVRWSAHADSVKPYKIDAAFMKRVKWAVDQALSNHLQVVLNIHHYQEMMADPAGQEERFLSLWEQISSAFAEYPDSLLFEILNEPRDQLNAPLWNSLLTKAIAQIRQTQPRRTLVVGSANWGGIDGLNALELPDDSNLIVTVHYYEPHQFTHQGALFEEGASAWLGQTWRATPAERAALNHDLKTISDWGKTHNRPLFLGEFGTYFMVDSTSRAFYTEYFIRKLDSLDIPWALWNFSSDFGVYNDSTGVWNSHLLKAILHPGNNPALDSAMEAGIQVDYDVYLTLDDFDSAHGYDGLAPTGYAWSIQNKVDPDSSHAYWFTYFNNQSTVRSPKGDSLYNIMDIIRSDSLPHNFHLAIGDWGEQGKGLSIEAKLVGDSYPYIGFGTAFTGWDSSYHYYDLCALTAIQFRAKGKGEWWMQLITDTVDNHYPDGDDWGHFGVHITLTDEWTDYLITSDLLLPKKYSPQATDKIPWSAACHKVNALEFNNGQSYGQIVEDSLAFSLDNVRLLGIKTLSNP